MKIIQMIALFVLMTGSLNSFSQKADKNGFIQLFDGKTLKGWEGDPVHWRVENGTIVGDVTPTTQMKTNTFLIWRGGTPTDFELKASYRISAGGNSGIQYRSEQLKDLPFVLKGYQADIDGANKYTGLNYEERGRGFLAARGQKVVIETGQKPAIVGSLGTADSLATVIKGNDDWNEYHLIVKGNHMQHYINGVLMSDATDNDTVNRKFTGLIGLQAHVTPSMKVEFRNILLKKL
ncbi:MAG: DUF1080 domain-containing protein [Chitinophagaceae bacterium]